MMIFNIILAILDFMVCFFYLKEQNYGWAIVMYLCGLGLILSIF